MNIYLKINTRRHFFPLDNFSNLSIFKVYLIKLAKSALKYDLAKLFLRLLYDLKIYIKM